MSKKQKLEQLPHFSSKFYPKEISAVKAKLKYSQDENKPFIVLENTINETKEARDKISVGKNVAHWFLRDFRIKDNCGLSAANEIARKHNAGMIGFWVFCKEWHDAHEDSPFKLYYWRLALEEVHKNLAKLNIPVVTIEVEKRADILPTAMEFLKKHNVSHVFQNVEYEVDELRLATEATKLLLDEGIAFQACHDSCVVKPFELSTKTSGKQFGVFTPWYKVWVEYVNNNIITKGDFTYATPKKIEQKVEIENDGSLPEVEADEERFHKYHKSVGEAAAREDLKKYIQSDKIKVYDEQRDSLDNDVTSHLSKHTTAGTISTRTILRELVKAEKLGAANEGETTGVSEWVRQVSWRDFYRHVLCNWPHISMYKPYHLEYSELDWEYNAEHFKAWKEGRTGFPIVDASMRKLNEEHQLNNRARLILASFLAKNLLLDWREGERYFMSKLVDGDFGSNNGGWGFAASTGVDPQPYFRIFNPYSQSARFDPEGKFIKKWVPELRDFDLKGVHNPYEADPELAEKVGYPKPVVDYKMSRERALERFKVAMQEGKEYLRNVETKN